MFLLKLVLKVFLLPIMLILLLLRVVVKIGMELSSIVLGGLMLIVFGCIIYTIIQHAWSSVGILITMELFLVLVTAGAGILDYFSQSAMEAVGGLLKA